MFCFDSCDRHWTQVCFTAGTTGQPTQNRRDPFHQRYRDRTAVLLLPLYCAQQSTVLASLMSNIPCVAVWLARVIAREMPTVLAVEVYFVCWSVACICSSSECLTLRLQGFIFDNGPDFWEQTKRQSFRNHRQKILFGCRKHRAGPKPGGERTQP